MISKSATTNEHLGEVISESGDKQGESGDYMVAENGLARGGLMGPMLMVATATTAPTE